MVGLDPPLSKWSDCHPDFSNLSDLDMTQGNMLVYGEIILCLSELYDHSHSLTAAKQFSPENCMVFLYNIFTLI